MGASRFAIIVAAAAVVWGGCKSLECEPGTFEVNGECIVEAPISCGEGTIFIGGQCVSEGVTGCGRGTFQQGDTCQPNVALAGNAARLVSLDITSPPIMQDLFELDLAGYPDGSILMFFGIHAPGDATLRLYGGRGELQPPLLYLLDRDAGFATTATVDAAVLDSDPTVFELALTIDDSIELADATVAGADVAVYDRLQVLAGGQIVGVITPDAADRVVVSGLTLSAAFTNTSTAPDVDFDDDGTPESWGFAATFEAEPVWVF